jgi:hypothetical protein
LLFSQYCLKSKSPLPFEKSIPGLPRLEPHRKVNATTLYKFSQTFKTLRNTANLFSNLDFLPKSEFPKTLDLSMDFPMIFHGLPTPWIFGEAAGAADKKTIKLVSESGTKLGFHEKLDFCYPYGN